MIGAYSGDPELVHRLLGIAKGVLKMENKLTIRLLEPRCQDTTATYTLPASLVFSVSSQRVTTVSAGWVCCGPFTRSP